MNQDVSIYLENIKSQMRKGTLEFLILLIISRGEIYALDILKALKDVDMIVVEGTLYPLLSRLKRDGLLDYSWKESTAGPPRKYYSLTEKGTEVLKAVQDYWHKTTSSITNFTK